MDDALSHAMLTCSPHLSTLPALLRLMGGFYDGDVMAMLITLRQNAHAHKLMVSGAERQPGNQEVRCAEACSANRIKGSGVRPHRGAPFRCGLSGDAGRDNKTSEKCGD